MEVDNLGCSVESVEVLSEPVVETDIQVEENGVKPSREDESTPGLDHKDLVYSIHDSPAWYVCLLLGLQDFSIMFGSIVVLPIILKPLLCIDDLLYTGQLISTGFVVAAINTFIQAFLGVRLPIIQGGTFTFFIPILAILNLPQWQCELTNDNVTDFTSSNSTAPGLKSGRDWQAAMCEIQGAVIVASLLQVVIGLSGLTGLLLRFIGPVSIAPTVSLIGFSLLEVSSNFAASNWWVAIMTVFLIIFFSQHLRNIEVPYCKLQKGQCTYKRYPVFRVFPILIAIVIAWTVCGVLTVTGAVPDDAEHWAYSIRTDAKIDVLRKAAWFRFPYPGQWGLPTVSTAGVVGMFSGVLAGIVESIGDYYACARLSGAPPPPLHAINRGVLMEGLGCILAGVWGVGTGTTSYSENIGAIGITKVGNRRVTFVAVLIMLIVGIIGKFTAFFAMMPDPIVGGILMTAFGMISGVGLTNLQFIDLSSSRNLFIVGFSIFFGLALPRWMVNPENAGTIDTGTLALDQTLRVLLSTSVFVGGALAVILDNTVPASMEERGMSIWREQMQQSKQLTNHKAAGMECYDLPVGMSCIRRWGWTTYVPLCPTFTGFMCKKKQRVASQEQQKQTTFGSK